MIGSTKSSDHINALHKAEYVSAAYAAASGTFTYHGTTEDDGDDDGDSDGDSAAAAGITAARLAPPPYTAASLPRRPPRQTPRTLDTSWSTTTCRWCFPDNAHPARTVTVRRAPREPPPPLLVLLLLLAEWDEAHRPHVVVVVVVNMIDGYSRARASLWVSTGRSGRGRGRDLHLILFV